MEQETEVRASSFKNSFDAAERRLEGRKGGKRGDLGLYSGESSLILGKFSPLQGICRV